MQKYPFLLALLAAALFGAATPASKALLRELTSWQLAGLLYLGAALGVLYSAGVRQVWWVLSRMDSRNRRRLWGAVLAGGVLGPVVMLAGLQIASAASVSLWLNLELLATALLGHWVFQDYLTRSGWLGVTLALAAAVTLSFGSGQTGIVAGSLVLLACVCWGLDNHLTALIDGITPSQSTFWKGIVAGSVNLAFGVFLHPFVASWTLVGGALGIGVCSYGASIVLYIHAAQQLGATRGQTLFATAPFFGLGFSVVLLGENLQTPHLLASFFFLGAILCLFVERHAHVHAHQTMTHAHRHRHDDLHHLHDHPDFASGVTHTHWHTHESATHTHLHWPDLHHRHEHKTGNDTHEHLC